MINNITARSHKLLNGMISGPEWELLRQVYPDHHRAMLEAASGIIRISDSGFSTPTWYLEGLLSDWRHMATTDAREAVASGGVPSYWLSVLTDYLDSLTTTDINSNPDHDN